MKEVGAFEAKNTLGSLLDRVERGEEITITRHGRPVARLVPNTAAIDRAQAQAALDRIRARASQVRPAAVDSELLAAVEAVAQKQHRELSDVIADLANLALKPPPAEGCVRNGVPLLPRRSGAPVTPDLVNALRDELP